MIRGIFILQQMIRFLEKVVGQRLSFSFPLPHRKSTRQWWLWHIFFFIYTTSAVTHISFSIAGHPHSITVKCTSCSFYCLAGNSLMEEWRQKNKTKQTCVIPNYKLSLFFTFHISSLSAFVSFLSRIACISVTASATASISMERWIRLHISNTQTLNTDLSTWQSLEMKKKKKKTGEKNQTSIDKQ